MAKRRRPNHRYIKKIYKRDNYTCQRCSKTTDSLVAHHIIPFQYGGPNHGWNLITLCETCHDLIHYELKEESKYLYIPSNNPADNASATPVSSSSVSASTSSGRLAPKSRVKTPKKAEKRDTAIDYWLSTTGGKSGHSTRIENGRPKKYSHRKKRIQHVFARDNYTCQTCGEPDSEVNLVPEYLTPIEDGGLNMMSNLTTSCKGCHPDHQAPPTPLIEKLENIQAPKLEDVPTGRALVWRSITASQSFVDERPDISAALCLIGLYVCLTLHAPSVITALFGAGSLLSVYKGGDKFR